MKHSIMGTLLLTLTGISPAFADVPQSWIDAQGSYEVCERTGGDIEEYFESVELTVSGETITFVTQTKHHGPIATVYQPDGLVRRGNDFHYLEDGSVLGPIPSHEASFWDDGTLVREEITYLPGNSYAMEANQITLGASGKLDYVFHVDDQLWLSASCSQEISKRRPFN